MIIINNNLNNVIKKLEELGKKFVTFTDAVGQLSKKIEKLSDITEDKMENLKESIVNLSVVLKEEDENFSSSIIKVIGKLSNELSEHKEKMNIPIIKEAADEIKNLEKQTRNIDLSKQLGRGLRDITKLIVLINKKIERRENESGN